MLANMLSQQAMQSLSPMRTRPSTVKVFRSQSPSSRNCSSRVVIFRAQRDQQRQPSAVVMGLGAPCTSQITSFVRGTQRHFHTRCHVRKSSLTKHDFKGADDGEQSL